MVYALKEIDERLARREYQLLGELAGHGHAGGRGARDLRRAHAARGARAGRDPGHPVPRLLHVLPLRCSPTARGRRTDRPADRRDGRAAGAAAPRRPVLGRLLAVQHAVPPGRRHASRPTSSTPRPPSCTPRCPTASARTTSNGRRAGRRRAVRPAGRRPAARRRRPDRDRRGDAASATTRCGTSSPARRCSARRSSATGSPSGCDRLNELGFDVDEVELVTSERGHPAAGAHPGRRAGPPPPPAVRAAPGSRRTRTRPAGCSTTSCSFRGVPRAARRAARCPRRWPAHRWRAEVYDPVIAAIPADLRGRLAPAEIFHEILEHRWFLSEQAGRGRRHHRRGAVLHRADPPADHAAR